MQTTKHLSAIAFLATIVIVFCLAAGCVKEYSYEQQAVDTTVVITPPFTLPEPGTCAGCNYAAMPDSSWRFRIDGITYCGKAERSLIQFQGTAIAFAGPSACSIDSGFVATAKIDDTAISLNTSIKNVKATLSCYYYDKVGSTNPFFSPMGEYQTLIITDYNQQTHIAVGTFSGFVRVPNGGKKEIKDGRFRITLQ